MRKWADHKTKRRLLLFILAVILLTGFVVTNVISFQYLRDNLQQAVIDKELPMAADAIQSQITIDILPHIITAQMMANDLFIKQWLRGDETNTESLNKYLQQIKKQNHAFTSFVVSSKSQYFYNSEGDKVFEDESDPNASWYFSFINNSDNYELNSSYNTDNNKTATVFINHKVFAKDQFIGVVGVGIALDAIEQAILDYKNSFDSDIYFIGPEQNIIIQSQKGKLAAALLTKIPEFNNATSNNTQELVNFEYNQKDIDYLLTLKYIPQLKWWLLISQSDTSRLLQIRQVLYANTLIGLVTISGTLVLVFWVVSSFHKRLEKLATTDKLTGLGNRQTFEYSINKALALQNRTKESFSLILLDIDKFKNINDQYGHLKGDEVLKAVADILNDSVRQSDYVGRWGGEEFVILAKKCPIDQAIKLANKIRSQIAALTLLEQPVTVSIGVSESSLTDTVESLLHETDKALYQAKKSGRNCVIAA